MQMNQNTKVETTVARIMGIYNEEQPTPHEALQIALSIILSISSVMANPHEALDAAEASIKMMRNNFPANDERVQ